MYREGDEIDIWVVEAPLGQGGMGSVYRCHNRSARRILAAIKVLDGSLNRIPKIQARFIREAEILFALDHPHIVKVRNVRVDFEPPYLEMEFVDGMSLEARLEQGPLPLADAVMVLREMASALGYLHARSIRHRDLKPSNIVCQVDGHSKLVDFGIATEMDGVTISEQGQAMGSASYVPPEWAQVGQLDPVRWDLYALGICIWESLTGDVAFPMPTEGTPSQRFLQTVAQKQTSVPLDPGPRFPLALRTLIRDLTHPNPRLRIQTAAILQARVAALDLDSVDASHVFVEGEPERAVGEALSPAPGPSPVHGRRIAPEQPPPAVSTVLTGRRADPTFDETSTVRPRGVPVGGSATTHVPQGAPARRRSPALLLGLLGLGALGMGTIAFAAVWTWSMPASPVVQPAAQPSAPPVPAARPLTLIVSGVPAGIPVALSLDGAPIPGDAGRWSAGAVAVGTHALVSTVGADCGQPIAVWCKQVANALTVKDGVGEQAEVIQLPAPGPREVTLAGLDGNARIEGVGDAQRSAAGRKFEALMPGRYAVALAGGRAMTVDVPWAEGPLVVPMQTTNPAASNPGTPTVAAVQVVPEKPVALAVESAPTARGADHTVTVADYARWLATHPDWQHDAAIAAGAAEDGYLKGWNGAEPPAGRGERAMVNVSWAAAQAYCRGHGGLADVGAEPLAWQESATEPWHEYRQENGAPAWRRSDGSVSPSVPRAQVNGVTGIRCAKSGSAQ